MSDNWVNDMEDMHHKFGVHEWFEANKDNKDLTSPCGIGRTDVNLYRNEMAEKRFGCFAWSIG